MPIGERCIDHTSKGHQKTTTLLNALRLEGVMEQATVAIDGAVNGEIFTRYTQECLAPSLRLGDVVVMDNLSSHKSNAVIQAIESAGASVWFLPAYSPDLNPIEKLWSKVKAWLRRVRPKGCVAIGDALVEVLRRVTPKECENYFAACG